VLDSLQLSAKFPVSTPSTGRRDDVIIAPAVSDEDAKEKFPRFSQGKGLLRYTAANK